MSRGFKNPYSQTFSFWVVFLVITALLVGGAYWVVTFVRGRAVAAAEAEAPPLNPAYVNYSTSGQYISPESDAAIQEYLIEFPEPQNVQVLTGMSTAEIWNFMTGYVSGGMKQDCSYCHNINNFAAEGADIGDDEVATRRDTARLHLEMVADLNQNWLTPLADIEGKQPSGSQIICATCHNGQAQPVAWPENLHALPDDYRLPLDDLDVLKVTGNLDVSLETVQYNQHTMYHMNESMGVGCTHCHNSRYFPSKEQPANHYALMMLQMSQHIRAEYQDSMNGQEPSCSLCHQNQVLPPGAVKSETFLPEVLQSSYSP